MIQQDSFDPEIKPNATYTYIYPFETETEPNAISYNLYLITQANLLSSGSLI